MNKLNAVANKLLELKKKQNLEAIHQNHLKNAKPLVNNASPQKLQFLT